MLLGILFGRLLHFDYGVRTLYDQAFNPVRLYNVLTLTVRQKQQKSPATPTMQRLPAITHDRFSLIRFRSPLLTEYLFLAVLRCFTSRRSLHTPYIFRCGSHDMTRAGFPHSDILGSRFVYQLPEAYRRLLRPSSALHAKAFTVCS